MKRISEALARFIVRFPWLLILLAGNAVFAAVNLYSGISHAVDMGLSDHPILQMVTGAICVLNLVLIYFVLRRSKRSAYALVAGLVIAATLFATTWWASVDPADPSGDRVVGIVLSIVVFIIGLVITVVSAIALRPVMRQPKHQVGPPSEPGISTSDSPDTHDGGDFDKA